MTALDRHTERWTPHVLETQSPDDSHETAPIRCQQIDLTNPYSNDVNSSAQRPQQKPLSVVQFQIIVQDFDPPTLSSGKTLLDARTAIQRSAGATS